MRKQARYATQCRWPGPFASHKDLNPLRPKPTAISVLGVLCAFMLAMPAYGQLSFEHDGSTVTDLNFDVAAGTDFVYTLKIGSSNGDVALDVNITNATFSVRSGGLLWSRVTTRDIYVDVPADYTITVHVPSNATGTITISHVTANDNVDPTYDGIDRDLTLTILDDDSPVLTIADTTDIEDDVGFVFTVSLSEARASGEVTVKYFLEKGDTTGMRKGQPIADGHLLTIDGFRNNTGDILFETPYDPAMFTIPAGQQTYLLTLEYSGADSQNSYESDETFTLFLFEPSNAQFDATEIIASKEVPTAHGSTMMQTINNLISATGTVEDDDPKPTLSIRGSDRRELRVDEGDSIRFTIEWSASSSLPITLDIERTPGTATGADYETNFRGIAYFSRIITSLSVVDQAKDQYGIGTGTHNTIPMFELDPATGALTLHDHALLGDSTLRAVIVLETVQDTLPEGDETFTIALANVNGNGQISSDKGSITVIIVDDDASVSVSPRALTASLEGEDLTYEVALRGSAPSQDVTVTPSKGSRPDTELSLNPAQLVFTPMNFSTAQTVTVSTSATRLNENATITHAVSDSTTYGDVPSVVVTPEASVSVSPRALTASLEGEDLTYEVVLRGSAPSQDVTVTPSKGSRPDTELSLNPAQLVFTPMNFSTAQTVTVSTGATRLNENATITHAVSDSTTYTDVPSVVVTPESYPRTITIADESANEGDGIIVFTLGLNPPFNRPAGKDPMELRSGIGEITNSGFGIGDFIFSNGVDITVPNGATSVEFTIDLVDDRADEMEETFTFDVSISPSIRNGLGDSFSFSNYRFFATGTVTDSDPAPTLCLLPPTGAGGGEESSACPDNVQSTLQVSEGVGEVVFTVAQSATSSWQMTVEYATRNGTAVAGSDYAGVSGTLTFAVPARHVTDLATHDITVPITDDDVAEDGESFTIALSNPNAQATLHGSGTSQTITVTIEDNDVGAFISPSRAPLVMVLPSDGSDPENARYEVSLVGPAPAANVTITPSAAPAGVVTLATPGTSEALVFTPTNHETAQTVTVSATAAAAEAGDTVTVTHALSGSRDYAAATVGSVTIVFRGGATANEVTGIAVTSRPAAASDTYGDGENIRIRVSFSSPVRVTGSPQLKLTVGDESRLADLAGTPTGPVSALVFEYAVQAGDADADGIETDDDDLWRFDQGDAITDAASGNAVVVPDAHKGFALTNAKIAAAPPQADAGDDQEASEEDTVTLDGSGSSAPGGTAISSYQWRADADNGIDVMLENADQAVATFTAPNLLAPMTLTFELTVTGDGGETDTDEVTVTVDADNDPPTATSSTNPATVDEGATVTLTGTGNDPEGQPITFAWSIVEDAGQDLTLDNTDEVTTTFTAPTGLVGNVTLNFQLEVGDGVNKTPATVQVTVRAARSVQANAGEDPDDIEEEDVVTLDGSGSSGEGGAEIASYQWRADEGNDIDVTLTDADEAVATFTVPNLLASVELTFELTVTGDGGETDTDEVTVAIDADNDPPTAQARANPATVNEGEPVTLTGTGSDPEGQDLTFAWSIANDADQDFTLDGTDKATATFTAPTGLAQDVTLNFKFEVSDGANKTPATVQVTVRAVDLSEALGESLSRMGRVMAASARDAVGTRLSLGAASAKRSSGLTLNGSRIDHIAGKWPGDWLTLFAAGDPDPASRQGSTCGGGRANPAFADCGHFTERAFATKTLRLPSLTPWEELPNINSFEYAHGFGMPSPGIPSGLLSNVSLWGEFDTRTFESEATDSLTLEGSMTAFYVGIDKLYNGRDVAGIALGLPSNTVDFADGEVSGEITLSMVNFLPYASWSPDNGLFNVWGMLGFGSGESEVAAKSREAQTADTSMTLFAGGGSMPLATVYTPILSDLHVTAKADAFSVSMSSDATETLAEQSVSASQLRGVLEGRIPYAMSDTALLEPLLELGLRFDGGDGDTGMGMEMGLGAAFTNTAMGFSADGRARFLVFHGGDGVAESGFSLLLLYDPGSAGGPGLSLAPVWGETASQSDALWRAQDITGLALSYGKRDYGKRDYGQGNDGPSGNDKPRRDWYPDRMDLSLHYGFEHARWMVTPYGALVTSNGSRQHTRLGLRLEALRLQPGTARLNLFNERAKGPGLEASLRMPLR